MHIDYKALTTKMEKVLSALSELCVSAAVKLRVLRP